MKCLQCGEEMEPGTVSGFGLGLGHGYEFTSDEEKKKTGIKGFLTRETINVATPAHDGYPAWYCAKCKKILMWADSEE